MAKRDRDEMKNSKNAADGNAIGLTQAFAPVDEEGFVRRGRHARVDSGDDWTPDDAAWDAFESGEAFEDIPVASEDFEDETTDIVPAKRGKHAKHAAVVDEVDEYGFDAEPVTAELIEDGAGGKHGKKGKKSDEDLPEYMRKSRRMRKILTVVIVLLVLLALAAGAGIFQIVKIGQEASVQQTQNVEHEASSITGAEANDASSAVTVKKTNVPDLASLIGLTQDEAIEKLGSGAQVTASIELNEAGNPITKEVRVALTEEPSDSRTGTPTVYLGLNDAGKIIQAGYSTSTTSLGYGSLSFADAVRNEHIIEKTLAEAGITVAEGTVSLPEDKMAYSTYGTDGTTLTKEYCSFAGDAEVNGSTEQWSAVLSYDYAVANATGNLADTVRTIYVYIG